MGDSVIVNTVLRVKIEAILPSRIIVRDASGHEGIVVWPEVSWDSGGSDVSWLAVGADVEVFVTALIEGGTFVGSFRRVHPELDPWARVDDLVVGNIVECSVFSFTSWGAMMLVRPGVYAGWRAPRSEVGAIGDRHRMVIEAVEVAWRNVIVSKALPDAAG